MKYVRSDILFRKIGIRSGVLFQKIGIRNGYVFEASMARPQPKSGQVHPRALKPWQLAFSLLPLVPDSLERETESLFSFFFRERAGYSG